MVRLGMFFISLAILMFSSESTEVWAFQTKKINILNMEKLNTVANEDDPCIMADNSQLIFTSDEGGTVQLRMASRKNAGEPLTRERIVDELAGEGECRSACLLPKDKEGWEYLYFATQYHTDKKKPNLDLYRVGRFSPQRPFQGYNAASPVQITATVEDEAYPCLSADGKELYFSRRKTTGWKLMRCLARELHVYESMAEVTMPEGYHHVTLSRSGLTMILQGPVKPGEPMQGLFFSKRPDKQGLWSEPKPLLSLNVSQGTIGTCSPCLSADNKYLYFASDRPGGKGGLDLYVVAVGEIEELKK